MKKPQIKSAGGVDQAFMKMMEKLLHAEANFRSGSIYFATGW